MGPEQHRLIDRLFDDPTRKLRNFSITPGNKPATAEEICGEINKAMDEIERRRSAGDLRGDDPPRTHKAPVDLQSLVKLL
jgi:hypothetical protein